MAWREARPLTAASSRTVMFPARPPAIITLIAAVARPLPACGGTPGFNPFDGTIDDVAFYNKALTAQQVQLHYLDTVMLSITKSANKVVLSWPVGTLQAAPAVTGNYTNVTTATSPYPNAPSGSAMFYRVKVQ